MTDSVSQAAEREIASRVLSRRRFLPFVQRINPRYTAGWVHEDIAKRLEKFSDDVAKGLSPRLMILMPPRAGKSELASKTFPAWHLGRHPDHEMIACSYNLDLAMDFSKKIKTVLDSDAYQQVFEARLDPDNRSSASWGIHKDIGGYVAAGIGGGINGKGAHVLIIDDPIKNAEEADSATVREGIWDWFGSVAYTRLAPGGGVLVIQTWWHDDDLAGRLMTAMKSGNDDVDQYDIVKYPAIAEFDEYIDPETDDIVRLSPNETPTKGFRLLRKLGEALHPERFPISALKRIRATLPKRFWSALYQQNPVPDDGSFFTKDMFRRDSLPDRRYCNVSISWDFAIGIKKKNDFTVGTVTLQDSDDVIHVAEVLRFKSNDLDFIVDSILTLAKRWYHPSLIIGFEDGHIYKTLTSTLKKAMQKERFYPSTRVLPPLTDKEVRATPLQGRMQQGMVSFNAVGEWYDVIHAEMLRFPSGIHDDTVDSLAWNVQMVLDRQPPKPPREEKAKSWKDRFKNSAQGASHMSS
jgi:predicted phage terminase large subunit-like protein